MHRRKLHNLLIKKWRFFYSRILKAGFNCFSGPVGESLFFVYFSIDKDQLQNTINYNTDDINYSTNEVSILKTINNTLVKIKHIPMTCAFRKAPIKLGVISKQHLNETQNNNSTNDAWITNNTYDTLTNKSTAPIKLDHLQHKWNNRLQHQWCEDKAPMTHTGRLITTQPGTNEITNDYSTKNQMQCYATTQLSILTTLTT